MKCRIVSKIKPFLPNLLWVMVFPHTKRNPIPEMDYCCYRLDHVISGKIVEELWNLVKTKTNKQKSPSMFNAW